MIFLNSRYSGQNVFPAYLEDGTVKRTVLRMPPTVLGNTEYRDYLWVEGDRVDAVAARVLGDPGLWWYIMDLNPEIPDPLSIQPGTVVRVPRSG